MRLFRETFRSMRARMTFLFSFAVALLMLTGGSAVVHRERTFARRQMDQALEVALERAVFEANEHDEPDPNALLKTAQENEAEIAAGGLVLLVTDSKGKLLWLSRHIPFPIPEDDWKTRRLESHGQVLILAGAWRPVEDKNRHTAFSVFLLGCILVPLSGLGAWIVVGRTLSPIHKLASQAAAASPSEPGTRLSPPSADSEMVYLAGTFNGLLERLEADVLSRGRFYTAASHELRTPLQALQGHLDVALSRPREAAQYESALREAQVQTERLTSLVQELLHLTSLETGSATVPATRVDFGDLLDRILGYLTGAIVTNHISLMTRIPDVAVIAPLTHLEILVRNLLENAIKYAIHGTVVDVELYEEIGEVKLRVFNHCDLPEGSNPADWFEPFYRPDESRNSLTGGNGLGLAIAASVARVNEWNLSLRSVNDGIEAVLIIPKHPPAADE